MALNFEILMKILSNVYTKIGIYKCLTLEFYCMAKVTELLLPKRPDSLHIFYCSNCDKLYETNIEHCALCHSPIRSITGFLLPNGKILSVDMTLKIKNIATNYLDKNPGLHTYQIIFDAIKRKIYSCDDVLSFEAIMIRLSDLSDGGIRRLGNYYGTKMIVQHADSK